VLIIFGTHSFSQRKHDLGVLFSASNQSKIALEYRLSLGEKYRFKVGTQYGSTPYRPDSFNQIIISASDNAVVTQSFQFIEEYFGVKVGLERQLRESPFSILTDLNLTYVNQYQTYRNKKLILVNDVWVEEPKILGNGWPKNFSRLKNNFLNPSLRLGFNADFKISNHFLINTAIVGNLRSQIFLKESYRVDHLNVFPETNPSGKISLFKLTTSIGLRYQFSGRKKNK